MAGANDRTFNLGLSITVPPNPAQSPTAASPQATSPSGPSHADAQAQATSDGGVEASAIKSKRMSRRQRRKSDQMTLAESQQTGAAGAGQEPKRRGWLSRLFSRDKSATKGATSPSTSPTGPGGTLQVPESPSSPVQQPTSAACPSPRLTSKLRPSVSADANLSTLATKGGHQTAADVTPNATTLDDDIVIDERALQPMSGSPGVTAGPKAMQRSVSEGGGATAQTNMERVGPQPVEITVKAVKSVRQKDIDPTVDLRQLVLRGVESDTDFGMTLAGANPVLVMSVAPGSPADNAGMMVNDMITTVGAIDVVRQAPAQISTLLLKASHTVPRKKSQPPAKVSTGAATHSLASPAILSELKEHVRKSPNVRTASVAAPEKEPEREPEKEPEKEPMDAPTMNIDDVSDDYLDGEEGDEVLRRLEEAADLIKDAVDLPDMPVTPMSPTSKAPEFPQRDSSGQPTLGIPSLWNTDGSGKPAGSAPSSPRESRRATATEMSFEEMASMSKSAPTSPGTQRKNKLKRSASSKGSAFIVEHKSGRMTSIAARKTILDGKGDAEAKDELARKKVQLDADFQATHSETLDLEKALGKATAKLGTRKASVDSSPVASPDIVLTPPQPSSPVRTMSPVTTQGGSSEMTKSSPATESKTKKVSSDMGSKIAGLQQALLASSAHQSRTSVGAQKGVGAMKTSTTSTCNAGVPAAVEESTAQVKALPHRSSKPSVSDDSKGMVLRSKTLKAPSRKISTSDFDDIALSTSPKLGVRAGHAKRDIARGRSVRRPTRPRSVHSPPTKLLGSEDLFVTEPPTGDSPAAKEETTQKDEPQRKQGVWDVNLSPMKKTNIAAAGGNSPQPSGVNLVIQTRLQSGSPGGSPIRRSTRMSSANIIDQATQNHQAQEAPSPGRSMKPRSRSVPLLDDRPADDDQPKATAPFSSTAENGAVSAKPTESSTASGGLKVIIPTRRRAKTVGLPVKHLDVSTSPSLGGGKHSEPQWVAVARGKAERLQDQPDDGAEAGTAEKKGVRPSKPAIGLKPTKARKSSPSSAPVQQSSAPDWIALAKARQNAM